MIYLNNAASSYPKPACVIDACRQSLEGLPSGQFRSSIQDTKGKLSSEQARHNMACLLGVSDPSRIFFTSGATESLNLLVNGFGIHSGNILTTSTEHNSVLRPLFNSPLIKGKPEIISCDSDGAIDPEKVENAITEKTKLLIVNHCSNVTGAVQDIASLGEIAKKYHLIFLLDASQSAGAIPVKADQWHVDAVAFTGHKSLLGLQGTGGFFLRDSLPFRAIKYGGTGRKSDQLIYPDGDLELEAGTQNEPGIAALAASTGWIIDQNINVIQEKESALIRRLELQLSDIPGVHIYGHPKVRGPLLSFGLSGFSPSDTSYILQNSFGIVTRAGLQCAPLIHKDIGSKKYGTVRASVSVFNKAADIDALTGAIREILKQ